MDTPPIRLGIAGLVEIVYAQGGHAGMPDIANELNFAIDDLLPLVDAAALLDLLQVRSGDLELTSVGTDFTTADIQIWCVPPNSGAGDVGTAATNSGLYFDSANTKMSGCISKTCSLPTTASTCP